MCGTDFKSNKTVLGRRKNVRLFCYVRIIVHTLWYTISVKRKYITRKDTVNFMKERFVNAAVTLAGSVFIGLSGWLVLEIFDTLIMFM